MPSAATAAAGNKTKTSATIRQVKNSTSSSPNPKAVSTLSASAQIPPNDITAPSITTAPVPPNPSSEQPPPSSPPAPNQRSLTAGAPRRSAHHHQDPVIAPGYGTRRDLQRLAAELSQGHETLLPVEAVEAIMKSRGRGIRSAAAAEGSASSSSQPTNAAAPISSAWADFMKEEGMTTTDLGAATAPAVPEPTTTSSSTHKSSRGQTAAAAAAAEAESAAGTRKRVYELPTPTTAEPAKKRGKATPAVLTGRLLQTGTLDSSVVGRNKMPAKVAAAEGTPHLMIPTQILPSIQIHKVFTGCNAVHSVAVDANGRAYGWGRNESGQIGPDFPDDVPLPTALNFPSNHRVHSAALGKAHTLFLMADHSVWAVGANKSGQCGCKTSTELVTNYRQCPLPDEVTVVQIACGEDFSVALSSDGHIYSTGSSEYGQLGNGETGQYFVTANKLAFTNCYSFTLRAQFCHVPAEKVHTNKEVTKVVPLEEDIRIQHIACGKHHTLAVEATSDQKARVFSWGCGDYGCLGHGIQADEYLPRSIGMINNLPIPKGQWKVSAGAHCSLLLTPLGQVYYWGKHRSVGEAVMRPQLVEVLANNGHQVAHCAAGGQTVVCTTAGRQTVAWGQGPHGELGLDKAKSSAKPTFVTALDGYLVSDLACGYGHTLFVVPDDDSNDEAKNKLSVLDTKAKAVQSFIQATEARGSKKRS